MSLTDHYGTEFAPGAVCVAKVLDRMEFKPTAVQAKQLWDDVRAALETHKNDFSVEIQSMLASTDGNLDTMERGDLMDAIGDVLAGMPWPLNGDRKATKFKFRTSVDEAMEKRGIQTARNINSDMSPGGL